MPKQTPKQKKPSAELIPGHPKMPEACKSVKEEGIDVEAIRATLDQHGGLSLRQTHSLLNEIEHYKSQLPQKEQPMKQISVLDKGFVRLDVACADDLSVVNAARVSLHARHETMETGDDKLIAFLMKNKHGTPFEHNFMRFHVKAPIMVFREWHRHRIGISINEWSARYSKMEREFYIPAPEQVRHQVGKPGAYTFEAASADLAADVRDDITRTCEHAFDAYEEMLLRGIAKEQARLVLPVNTYSEMYWSCNARSLMAFLALRTSEHAMWEIRQYALALETIWSELMPITHEAFIANERKAP